MPPKQRIPADEAMLFVSSIRERLLSSALTSEESFEALQKSAALGIICGKVYDLMPAQCASKSGAKAIYTGDTRHYAQCGTEAVRRLRTP